MNGALSAVPMVPRRHDRDLELLRQENASLRAELAMLSTIRVRGAEARCMLALRWTAPARGISTALLCERTQLKHGAVRVALCRLKRKSLIASAHDPAARGRRARARLYWRTPRIPTPPLS